MLACTRGSNLRGFKHICLKNGAAKATIWPWLSYMCHVRSTAEAGRVAGEIPNHNNNTLHKAESDQKAIDRVTMNEFIALRHCLKKRRKPRP